MPTCRKCGEGFPNRIRIDGKTKNLRSRRYCLTCSPFGGNNRQVLEAVPSDRRCSDCSRPLARKFRCNTCTSRRRRDRLRAKLFKLVGDRCEVCGYGGTPEHHKILELHHRNAADKRFELSVTDLSERPWSEVVTEARKCAVLCPNHHREVHVGLLTLAMYPSG